MSARVADGCGDVLGTAVRAEVPDGLQPTDAGAACHGRAGEGRHQLIDPIRRLVPPVGMIDLSPMVAWLVLWIARGVVLRML